MMNIEQLKIIVIEALEEIKASQIKVLDVRGKANFTDIMVIASGNTDRQVKALANNLLTKVKEKGLQLVGLEGELSGEWVLIDLGDIVVHVMQPDIRVFYNLEKLWGETSPNASQHELGQETG